MRITIEKIKQLREVTGAPIMECRTALEETDSNIDKAKEILKKKGAERADKKAFRETKFGKIEIYSHMEGKIGVMVEVLVETDFVARNNEFKNLTHELTLQIASMNPGSVESLMLQPWIRDESKTIEQLVKETIGKLGENIKISRFVRFELGEQK